MKSLEPLKLLPREQWEIGQVGPRHLKLGIFTRGTAECGLPIRYWLKCSIFAFPNDFISLDDLKDAGVLAAYGQAVEELSRNIPSNPRDVEI